MVLSALLEQPAGTIRIRYSKSNCPISISVSSLSRSSRQAMTRCSRFCNGQSTQEQQGSTGLGEETVTYSIETAYFHSISTNFHKQRDLLWEQRVVSSNLTVPTNTIY